MKKENRGGSGRGQGRKPTPDLLKKEKTKVMRIRLSKVDAAKKLNQEP